MLKKLPEFLRIMPKGHPSVDTILHLMKVAYNAGYNEGTSEPEWLKRDRVRRFRSRKNANAKS